MKWRDWLAQWGLDSLKINLQFLEMEWSPQDADRNAAWDLYVELLTRITGQPLADQHGDVKTALDSIHSLFPLTRDILRKHGPGCGQFAKVGIPVLNQIIRPFTTKWHRLSLDGAFNQPERCREFRAELGGIQSKLHAYTQALATMANVEDLTQLEKT
jgi:hypothetical protein